MQGSQAAVECATVNTDMRDSGQRTLREGGVRKRPFSILSEGRGAGAVQCGAFRARKYHIHCIGPQPGCGQAATKQLPGCAVSAVRAQGPFQLHCSSSMKDSARRAVGNKPSRQYASAPQSRIFIWGGSGSDSGELQHLCRRGPVYSDGGARHSEQSASIIYCDSTMQAAWPSRPSQFAC